MKKFAISVAALIAVAAFVTIPASAEMNYGPVQQNGKCWQAAAGPAGATKFGYWGDCPQTASAVTTTTVAKKHPKHPATSR